MKQLSIKPDIYKYDTAKAFAEALESLRKLGDRRRGEDGE